MPNVSEMQMLLEGHIMTKLIHGFYNMDRLELNSLF